MAEAFDPYHKWLGIAPHERPIHYYRLLAIPLLESDADVISTAADQRMTHLKQYRAGASAEVAEKLLNEISAARVCLLNPEKKAAYDAALQGRLAQAAAPSVEAAGTPPPLAAAGEAWEAVLSPSGPAYSSPLTRRRRQAPYVWIAVTGGLAACALAVVLAIVLSQGGREEGRGDSRKGAGPTATPAEIAARKEKTVPPAGPSGVQGTTPADAGGPAKAPDDGGPRGGVPGGAERTPPGGSPDAGEKPPPNPPVPQGLVGHWKFDETGPMAVDSVGGHDGQIRGAERIPGRIGGGLAFDGRGSFVVLNTPGDLDFPGAIGLAAWVRTEAPRPGDESPIQTIIGHGPGSSGPGEVYLRIAHGNLEVGSNDGRPHGVRRPFSPDDYGRWVHLAGVYDGSAWRLFRNGKTIATHYDPVGAVVVPASWFIGARGDGKSEFFRGQIDDVRIYRGPVTAPVIEDVVWAAGREPVASPPGTGPGPGETPPPGGVAATPTPGPSPIKPKRLPAPGEDARGEARKQVIEVYGERIREARQQPPQQRLQLAETLARAGADAKEQPAARYVLLRLAADQAAQAGDFKGAVDYLDRLSEAFEGNVSELKADVAEQVAGHLPANNPVLLLNTGLPLLASIRRLADDAIRSGELKAAGRLLRTALSIARRVDRKQQASIQAALQEARQLEDRWAKTQKAVEVIQQEPDNAKALGYAGAWYCLVAGDWEKGLPWLAKGDGVALAELARADLAGPKTSDDQVALADRWWSAGEERSGVERARLRERAAHWYQQALPSVSGLARVKIEKRLDEADVRLGGYALKFDGKKSCVVVESFPYDGRMATIEAIVKPTRSPTAGVGDGYQTAISNVHGGGAGLFLQYTRWNFAYHYSLRYSSSTYPYSYRVYAAKSPPPGQWVHVAGVFDGQKLSLYVDGELQGTAVVSNPHKQSPAPFVIGAEPSGGQVTWEPANFFEGLIKAVRISGAPLYTQNFTPPADLVAERNTALLLKFNAGHGDTVRDSVNKKLTARIKDAEWVKIE